MIGMSRQALAERVGRSPEEIERFETGASSIGAGLLWQISMELKVPVQFFFNVANEWLADGIEAIAEVMSDSETHKLMSSYYAIPEDQRRKLPNLANVLEGAV